MPSLGSAKLGEEKLGSVATTTTDEIDSVTGPRRRAESVMKSVYPTDEGTTWDALLNTLLSQYEHLVAVKNDVHADRHIDTASNEPLEKLGGQFLVERRQGESDAHLRKRIKSRMPAHTTRATINEVVRASTILLDCAPTQLEVHETPHLEPARFDVLVDDSVVSAADITIAEYVELLRDIKAAGVRVVATVGAQFTYRSAYEFRNGINDPDRGYGSLLDPEVGGPYADLVTASITPLLHPDYAYGDGGYGEGGYGTTTEYGEGGYGAGAYGN